MSQPLVRQTDQMPALVAEPSDIMGAIIRAASDPSTDIAKVSAMMALYERLEAKKAEMAFNDAMSEAQAEMRPVLADKDNSQTKSKYASYGALDRAVRPIYTAHGFSLSFDTGDGAPADYVRVLCYAAHKAGFSRTYKTDMPADGKGAKGGDVMTRTHATGSANTYGMRNLLKMIFNIAVGDPWDDDDGNAASGASDKISEEEFAELNGMVVKGNVDLERLCGHLKIPALAMLPKKRMGDVREILNIEIDTYQRKQAKK